MKIRMHGTEDECRAAAALIEAGLEVVSASDPYPDRGASRLVRVYLEVRLDPEVR